MRRTCIALAFGAVLVTAAAVAGAQGSTYVICISTNGYIDYDAFHPAITPDGRFTAFTSTSAWLVSGDNNNALDVFVHDALNGTTERVSVDSLGVEGNADSGIHGVAISSDGRYVAFASKATNLVALDTNGVADIFVHDRTTGATVRVSVDGTSKQANGASTVAALSADGRYVAFASDASNLAPGDRNQVRDVFVRDQTNGAVTRESVDPFGGDANGASGASGISISGDGRYVAFDSAATNLVTGDQNAQDDIFVRDRAGSTTVLASRSTQGKQADAHCSLPRLSADGAFVAFGSFATNLVTNDLNGVHDVFVRDLKNSTTTRVSVSSTGKEADFNCGTKSIAISGDGAVVAFESGATTLVPNYTQLNLSKIFFHDRTTGATTGRRFSSAAIVGDGPDGDFGAALSGDGRFAAFSSYAQFVEWDVVPHDYVFVVDRQFTPPASVLGGSTHVVSPAAALPEYPAVSADGRYVAFADGQHAYVFDRQTATTSTVSVSSLSVPGNGASGWPAISDDGRYVVFESVATNLVTNDTNNASDIFLHDRAFQLTTRLSLSSLGADANGESHRPRISGDGKFVCFDSTASNLVTGDTNLRQDVFVRDVLGGTTTLVSMSGAQVLGNDDSDQAVISKDGRYVAFRSAATNLVTGDTNQKADVFWHDRLTGYTFRVSVDSQGGQADDESAWPAISADGSTVAYESDATNLVALDVNWSTDVFVHNVITASTTRVSVDSQGNEADAGDSTRPSISADGRYVAFTSDALNLIPLDRNYAADVFVHDRLTGVTARASEDPVGWEGNNTSGRASQTASIGPRTPIAAGGGTVVFVSGATNLAPAGASGLLVRDLWPLLSTQAPPKIGQIVTLDLASPAHAGKTYQVAAAFTYRPGIPLTSGVLPLSFDPLLYLSLTFPVMFQNFTGVLDGTGQGQASIALPNIPALHGYTIYSAFIVIDPWLPSSVSGFSNALALKLTL